MICWHKKEECIAESGRLLEKHGYATVDDCVSLRQLCWIKFCCAYRVVIRSDAMQKNSRVKPWTWLAPLAALLLTTVVPGIGTKVGGAFEGPAVAVSFLLGFGVMVGYSIGMLEKYTIPTPLIATAILILISVLYMTGIVRSQGPALVSVLAALVWLAHIPWMFCRWLQGNRF